MKNRNLLIVAVVAVVNALGYGIIIPILYSYSHRFGLSDFQNGLLFATFSVFQFISTPIIGIFSDRFGRKPLLLISLAGTVLSFLLMGFARSAIWLFVARALDGATAGNIPVIQAVISDTTEPKDRAKGFGLIGASFGFGFIFGPLISALTVGYGMSIPFLISALVTLVAIILTAIFLPETNQHLAEVKHAKLFDFPKLLKAFSDPNIGSTLLVSLIYSLAFSLFIFAYQPVSVNLLHLSPSSISINFILFGLVGLISQMLIIPKVSRKLGEKKTLFLALCGATLTFSGLYLSGSLGVFMVLSMLHSLINGFISPMISTLLSKEVDALSQGEIQGVNASYVSIGMIFGPVIGGAVATISTSAPFLAGALMCLLCVVIAKQILNKKVVPVHLV